LPHEVRPDHLRVVVRGPKRLVDDLDLGNGAAYVDAGGQAPGRRVVKPAVDVPAGVELVSVTPTKVQLNLRKGKPPTVSPAESKPARLLFGTDGVSGGSPTSSR